MGTSPFRMTNKSLIALVIAIEPAAKAKNAEFGGCLVTNQSFDSGSRIRFGGYDLANGLHFTKHQVRGLYVFAMPNAQRRNRSE